MIESKENAVQSPKSRSSFVRFTESEYRKICRAQFETGESIPWLLKQAFFNQGIAPPTLDVESRQTVIRELKYMGNNINQIAYRVNSGLISNIKREIAEVLADFRSLRSFLGRKYGHSNDDSSKVER